MKKNTEMPVNSLLQNQTLPKEMATNNKLQTPQKAINQQSLFDGLLKDNTLFHTQKKPTQNRLLESVNLGKIINFEELEAKLSDVALQRDGKQLKDSASIKSNSSRKLTACSDLSLVIPKLNRKVGKS